MFSVLCIWIYIYELPGRLLSAQISQYTSQLYEYYKRHSVRRCLFLGSECSKMWILAACSLSLPLNIHISVPRSPSFCFYISTLRSFQISNNTATSAHVCLWPCACSLLSSPEHISSSANIPKSVLNLVAYPKVRCSTRCVLWPPGVQNHRESSWCSFSPRPSIYQLLGRLSLLEYLNPQSSQIFKNTELPINVCLRPLGAQNTETRVHIHFSGVRSTYLSFISIEPLGY